MSDVELDALLRRLESEPSAIERLRLLGRSWPLLERLSPLQRQRVIAAIDETWADEWLDRLLDKRASLSPWARGLRAVFEHLATAGPREMRRLAAAIRHGQRLGLSGPWSKLLIEVLESEASVREAAKRAEEPIPQPQPQTETQRQAQTAEQTQPQPGADAEGPPHPGTRDKPWSFPTATDPGERPPSALLGTVRRQPLFARRGEQEQAALRELKLAPEPKPAAREPQRPPPNPTPTALTSPRQRSALQTPAARTGVAAGVAATILAANAAPRPEATEAAPGPASTARSESPTAPPSQPPSSKPSSSRPAPSETASSESERSESESSETESAKPAPSKSPSSRAQPAQPKPAQPKLGQLEPTQSEPTQSEPTQSEPTPSEPTQSEPTQHPRPAHRATEPATLEVDAMLATTPASAGDRFELLRRLELEPGAARALEASGRHRLIAGLADSWAARRALLAMLRSGALDSVDEALELIALLPSAAQRTWSLLELAASRRHDPGEAAQILDLAPTATIRRRLERRLRR